MQHDAGRMLTGQFNYTAMRRVRYGPGTIESLPADLAEFGGRRALLIASSNLASSTELVKRVERLLGSAHAATYTGVAQHGPRKAVLEATRLAREHRADSLVSFGGGSPIDGAKMVALCLAEDVERADQLERLILRFEYPDKFFIPELRPAQIPIIAIPTTLSAGEFTPYAGALNEETRHKDLYFGPTLLAREVILDPEVTVHTPAWLWGASGVRAIDHSVETFLSAKHMPMSDALTMEALGKLIGNLAHSARTPTDLAARQECQFGAWLSIFALGNVSMGLSHAIGHQLGGSYNVTHGVTSAIMLPWVMEFNLPATLERQKRLAQAMGIDVHGMSDEAAGRAAISKLRAVLTELEIPTRLRDVAVPRQGFGQLVEHTIHDALVVTNPRPVTPEDILGLLENAY